MAYLNKIDINGRTYYLQHLTDGKYEAQLPALTKNDALLLQGQVINSVTSNESKNGSKVPLSAYQGYLLNTKLNQEVLDREADVGEEQARAEAAEQVLTNNLNKEIQDRIDDVNAEEARALAEEKVLTDNLAKEVTDRTNAVTTEQNRATAKENEISANLTSEINRAKAAEEANTAAIAKKVDKVDGKGLSTNDYTNAEKEKLEGIETGANKYVHPSYDVYTSGLYKITVDKFGHVSSVVAVSKDDIVGLGIPGQDTTYDDAIASLQSQIDELKVLVESYHPITEPDETE